jgi:hypothetical protein
MQQNRKNPPVFFRCGQTQIPAVADRLSGMIPSTMGDAVVFVVVAVVLSETRP